MNIAHQVWDVIKAVFLFDQKPFLHQEAQPVVDEMTVCVELDFGIRGNAAQFLMNGWSKQQPNFIWTEGYVAELAFDAPAPGRYTLCLDAIALGQQRLIVTVNGRIQKTLRVAGPYSTNLAIELHARQDRASIRLQLDTPDANSPKALFNENDTRILGFAFTHIRLLQRKTFRRTLPPILDGNIEAATSLSRTELMYHFESLGHNCEFGIAQRLCGAEPLGLLRFASITLPNLLRGLSTEFKGLGKLDGINHTFWDQSPDPEYIIREQPMVSFIIAASANLWLNPANFIKEKSND